MVGSVVSEEDCGVESVVEEGVEEGVDEGVEEGASVGASVGAEVGASVGAEEGVEDGASVGVAEGASVGADVAGVSFCDQTRLRLNTNRRTTDVLLVMTVLCEPKLSEPLRKLLDIGAENDLSTKHFFGLSSVAYLFRFPFPYSLTLHWKNTLATAS